MAHKLANGDYRHNDVLIRHRKVASAMPSGWTHEWEVRDVGNFSGTGLNKQRFDTLKEAAEAIDRAKATGE